MTWSDPTFKTALSHNARLLLAVPVLVFLSLLLSVLLYEGLRGWRFYRWAIFLPFILSDPRGRGHLWSAPLQFNGFLNQGLRGRPRRARARLASASRVKRCGR